MILFSDTLLSFTASVGPELFYYPAFVLYDNLLAGTVYIRTSIIICLYVQPYVS